MNRITTGNLRRSESHKLSELGATPSPVPNLPNRSLRAALLRWPIAALCFLTILSVNGQVSLNRPPTGTWTNAGNIVADGWLQFKETGGARLRAGAIPDGYLIQRSGTNLIGVAGAGAIGDGNKGDIVVSGSGTNWLRSDSVKRYGAIGNGVTNDRAAIQSAIDASTNITLFFPPGNYVLDGAGAQLLLIEHAVSLVGAGSANTKLVVKSTVGASTRIIRYHPPAGVAMSQLELRGLTIVPESGTPGLHAVEFDLTDMGMAYFTWDDVSVETPFGGNAVRLVNPTLTDGFFTSTFKRGRFAGGVNLQRAGDNIEFLERCNFYGPNFGIEASFVAGASSFTVQDGNFTSNPGMLKITGVSGLNINGNNFEWPQSGSTATNSSPLVDIVGLGDQVTTLNMSGNTLYAANIPNTDGIHTTYVKKGSMVSGNNIQVAGTGVKWAEDYGNYFDAETGVIGFGTTIPSTFGHFVVQADTNGPLKSVIRNISSSTNASSELEFNIQGYKWRIGMESLSNSNTFNWKFYDTTKLSLSQNGYLGFGTTNPLDHVHIRSAVPTMLFQKPGAVSWTFGNKFDNVFSIYPDSGTSNALNITSEGRVAIGRTNATQLLHVGGTALLDGLLGFGDVANYYFAQPNEARGMLGHSAYGWTLEGDTGKGLYVRPSGSITEVGILQVDGVLPVEVNLGTITNGGTVTFPYGTNHFRTVLSGATFNFASFPAVSSNTQPSIFLVYSNSSGGVQIGSLPIALINSGIGTNGASTSTITNQIGESSEMVFTASGGNWLSVSKSEPRVSGGGSDDQTAAEVPFTPTGTIAATDVQAAIAEVASEAASSATAVTEASAAGAANYLLTSAGADRTAQAGGATIVIPVDTAVTLSGGVNGINFATNTLSIDAANGRVGIGTASPTVKLEVISSDVSASGQSPMILRGDSSSTTFGNIFGLLELINANTTDNNYSQIEFTDTPTGGTASTLVGTKFVNHASNYGDLFFWTRGSDGGGNRLYLHSNGGVSIGNETSPGSTNLSVTGTVLANSAVFTNGMFSSLSKRIGTQYDATTTTLGTVTDLSVTVTAGVKYHFRARFDVTLDITGGGKYAIGGTATATAVNYRVTHEAASLALVTSARQTSLGSAINSTAGLTDDDVEIEGTIVVNAGGTLVVQGAQQSASGTTSFLTGGSFIVNPIP